MNEQDFTVLLRSIIVKVITTAIFAKLIVCLRSIIVQVITTAIFAKLIVCLMLPLHIPRIGPFLPVLAIILIPVFFPHVGPQKRLTRVVPGLVPGYSHVITVLSRVRPCYLSGHGSQATQNVLYSSILSALIHIKSCCSRVVPMLRLSCSRVAPVFPVLFPSCPVLSHVALYITVYPRVNTGYSRVVPDLLRVFPTRGLKTSENLI